MSWIWTLAAELRQAHHDILSNADSAPAELPPAIAGFTGRGDQLDRLSALTPLAVISGPPGVGKTALALRWAHRERARFPDGKAVALIGLAKTYVALGDTGQAGAHAARAGQLARDVGYHRLERLAVFPPGGPGKTRR